MVTLTLLTFACSHPDEEPTQKSETPTEPVVKPDTTQTTKPDTTQTTKPDTTQTTKPGTLQASGNRATNLAYTYAEKSNSWTAASDIYWKDNNTPIDIYGYYPIAKNTPKDIHAYEFSVASDQSVAGSDYAMGGYEQSDLLWGKVGNVAPTSQTIRLPLRHHMSTARIELTEGSGFTAGEFARMEKSVVVKNTGLTALVDLSNGSITTKGEAEATDIVPYENNGQWRCIIVPQTVKAGKELFAISIDSKPYTFSRDPGCWFPTTAQRHQRLHYPSSRPERRGRMTWLAKGCLPTASG
jgi:hypothetical protein